LSKSISGVNGVGIEFSRIIQDAPFGIIGVGNNITQLAGSFSNLQKQTGSASKALKLSLASIVSPANLVVLGVSAVTTALTLYAQSAKDTKSPINELKEAQDDFNESLKETDRLLGADVLNQFLKEVGLVEQQNIGGRLLDVPTFQSAAEVVDKLSGKISNLRKGELDLLAKFLQTEVSEAFRDIANAENELSVQLAEKDLELYQGVLVKINEQLAFYKTNAEGSTKATKDQLDAFTDTRWQEAIDNQERLNRALGGLTGNEGSQNQGLPFVDLGDTPPIQEIADVYEDNLDRIGFKVSELSNAFTGLGSLIGNAFNNTGLGTFVGEFLRFASQLVAANFKISTANAVTAATSSAAASGPGAIFTLPAFIAGAIGLVASAFSSLGGGSSPSIGSSGVGGGSAQNFGGAGLESSLLASGLTVGGTIEIDGTKLLIALQNAEKKRNRG
jgi:hypothetical protein